MAIIVREDGQRFAINNYRENIVAKKPALLKKELRSLAAIHGKFAKVYYPDPTNQQNIEAILSPEQGYLLGGLIWNCFDKKPDNLIYCEALANSENAILVIVHDRRIYLETELPKSNIITELAALLLLGDQIKFDIYIYGDVPIAENPTEGKFAFDKNMVNSFHVLEKPLYPTLEPSREYELLPLEEAIKELNLPGSYTLPILIVALVLFTVGYLWRVTHPREAKELAPIIEVSYINPYEQLQKALSTPSPAHIINQVCDHIDNLLLAPNWNISKLSFNNLTNAIVATVSSPNNNGFLQLMRWAGNGKYTIQPLPAGVLLTQKLLLPNRIAEKAIYSSALETYSFIYDSINKFFPYQAVFINTTKNNGSYVEMVITVKFQNISNTLLRQVGQSFRDQPITIQTIDLTIDHGLLSGSIKFSIFGAS